MAANLIYKSGSFAFNGNFLPTADKAIDARLVIDNSTSLIEIDHAYQGMVVTVTTAGNGVYFCNGADPTKYDSWVKLATTTGADVGEIATRVAGLEGRVSALETKDRIQDTSINGLIAAIPQINTTITDVSSRVNDVSSDLSVVRSAVTEMGTKVDDISSRITTVYRVKGSVAGTEVLPSEATVGDVYNVTETGMNYVYTDDGWDALGATVDLSGYYTKEHEDASYKALDTKITGVNTSLSSYKTSNDASIATIDTSIGNIYELLTWNEA